LLRKDFLKKVKIGKVNILLKKINIEKIGISIQANIGEDRISLGKCHCF